jgi:hypothetical protein
MREGRKAVLLRQMVTLALPLPLGMLATAAMLAACDQASDDSSEFGGGSTPSAPNAVGSNDSDDPVTPNDGGEVTSDAHPRDSSSVLPDSSVADVTAEVGVDAAGPPLDCSAMSAGGVPVELGCTTFYSSWPTRTIAASARAFGPAVVLWSDGAVKTRFIQLPAGTRIDTSNMDEWRFPVGTKLWKEFRVGGKLVETRLLWKRTASDWYRTTYAWTQDQLHAVETTGGVVNVWGTGYEIPAQSDCATCHNGHLDGVLGFEVIGLSNAGATGLAMSALVDEQLVTNPPAGSNNIPGNATERAALGWLHANCGNACHSNSNYALARDTGLHMRLTTSTVASVQSTDTWRTAVNMPSGFQGPGGGFYRLKPRDVAHSAIPYRDGYRDGPNKERIQMPPLGTHIVDTAGLKLVTDWVNSM